MDMRKLTARKVAAYAESLRREERAPATVEKYRRDAAAFAVWLAGEPVTKELASQWKNHLLAEGLAPVTVLKGKIRTILLPRKLCVKLLKYARKEKTASGEIFLTKSGGSLSRKQIWQEMKSLCARAGVEPSKVFPHNLRHLFAQVFYRVSRDLVRLADMLGHSSVETTRIYLLASVSEHAKYLERLRLVQ